MTKYTFFVHMNATCAWLRMSRQERDAYFSQEFGPLLAKYGEVQVRLFDVEAFSALCSDIAMFETENLQAYTFLMDALRDSNFYTIPYFEIVGIYPAIEEGFRTYTASL